ncbi:MULTISPECIES: hypothetical protein [unclassified Actinomyces]|uniref:hypothetical protein n=1 Tax=unclassified Actinomyces TaxID=2609248 RepID=UPI00137457AA|nr:MULTISPECIES: hypothetical protein [unclassified Actinomyces]MBW3069399.1 hypothetical protein [Actinomyces sp. 594]NDR54784.1 hypothetical protein [Actinomyces sp. 565]QHO90095.1 hypothetical protein CWT12_00360 [Actinomyces sp. 432]
MTIEILSAIVGSLATAVIIFFVSRRRYRTFLTSMAAMGGTITDAGLLSTLKAIIQTMTTASACAAVGTALLVAAGQMLNPLQVTITCAVILLLAAVLAWIYGRYAVLAELAHIRHLELPYGPWGLFLAQGRFRPTAPRAQSPLN